MDTQTTKLKTQYSNKHGSADSGEGGRHPGAVVIYSHKCDYHSKEDKVTAKVSQDFRLLPELQMLLNFVNIRQVFLYDVSLSLGTGMSS